MLAAAAAAAAAALAAAAFFLQFKKYEATIQLSKPYLHDSLTPVTDA